MSTNTAVMERPKVGRKKKEIPSDYVAVKIPRIVYVNAKLISTLTGKEMALVIGDAAGPTLAKQADEAFRASRAIESKSDKPKR